MIRLNLSVLGLLVPLLGACQNAPIIEAGLPADCRMVQTTMGDDDESQRLSCAERYPASAM